MSGDKGGDKGGEISGKRVIKGRGAVSNEASRFLPHTSQPVDDGWSQAPPDSGGRVRTIALADRTRTLLAKNNSPDIPFEHSINPYKGCEHGCIYCFARPTHAYLDLSPGLDFETRLFFKTDVAAHLQEELSRKGYRPTPIAMGTNTDPYQPLERGKRVTREVLKVLLRCRHPVTLVTKGQAALDDLDIWSELAALGLARVAVSVTTLSNALKAKLEPRTAAPSVRLQIVRRFSEAGIPTGVMFAPVIPFVNDEEMEEVVAAAADAGASHASYILLRLPSEVKVLFEEWLDAHYPLKKERVLQAIRSTRGGALYASEFGKRMVGEGEVAKLLSARFAIALKKNRLLSAKQFGEKSGLRSDLFVPPSGQQSLF